MSSGIGVLCNVSNNKCCDKTRIRISKEAEKSIIEKLSLSTLPAQKSKKQPVRLHSHASSCCASKRAVLPHCPKADWCSFYKVKSWPSQDISKSHRERTFNPCESGNPSQPPNRRQLNQGVQNKTKSENQWKGPMRQDLSIQVILQQSPPWLEFHKGSNANLLITSPPTPIRAITSYKQQSSSGNSWTWEQKLA